MTQKTFQDRAQGALVGALSGAQAGFRGMPRRFIDGLEEEKRSFPCRRSW